MRERRKKRDYGRRRHRVTGNVPSLRYLANMARAVRAEDDPRLGKLLKAVYHTQDPEIAMEAYEYIQRKAGEQMLNPDPFAQYIDKELAKGELILGNIRNASCIFGLLLSELVRHVLVVGSTGSGKTTLVRRLLRQVIELEQRARQDVKIMVFDIKRDYGHLAHDYEDVWLFKLPGKDFRWNPLEPPMRDCKRWAGILASVCANAWGFYEGSSTEHLLHDYFLKLYAKYDTDKGIYPCLLDMLDYTRWLKFEKKVDRYSEEFKSFIRIMNRLTGERNSFGETIDCSRGYPIKELLEHNVIFDLADLDPDGQMFFTEVFQTQCIKHRMETEERGGRLRNVMAMDEAKRLMPKCREKGQRGISNMSFNLAMSREFGFGQIISDCDPRLLAESIKSNCFARFCFSQTNGEDVFDSAMALGLKPEQAEEIHRLQMGECIVRLGGRITEPFVLLVAP